MKHPLFVKRDPFHRRPRPVDAVIIVMMTNLNRVRWPDTVTVAYFPCVAQPPRRLSVSRDSADRFPTGTGRDSTLHYCAIPLLRSQRFIITPPLIYTHTRARAQTNYIIHIDSRLVENSQWTRWDVCCDVRTQYRTTWLAVECFTRRRWCAPQ